MNPVKAVLLGLAISLPAYVLARLLGAGVVAGGAVTALVAIVLFRTVESE